MPEGRGFGGPGEKSKGIRKYYTNWYYSYKIVMRIYKAQLKEYSNIVTTRYGAGLGGSIRLIGVITSQGI